MRSATCAWWGMAMTTEPVSDLEIEAYIDGMLDPARRAAVEDHLSRHADAAARVMSDLHAISVLRMAFKTGQAVPATMSDASRRLGQRLTLRRWRMPVFMTAASVLGAVSLGAIVTAPGGVPEYVGAALISHEVALTRASMVSQVETPDFDKREIMDSTRIRIPSLLQGWKISDVQLVPGERGPALQMMIRTTAGGMLSIYALRTDKQAMTQPVAVQRDGNAVAYWNRNGIGYALVGQMPPADLDRTAEDLADNRLY